jgi:hypothetical protein
MAIGHDEQGAAAVVCQKRNPTWVYLINHYRLNIET